MHHGAVLKVDSYKNGRKVMKGQRVAILRGHDVAATVICGLYCPELNDNLLRTLALWRRGRSGSPLMEGSGMPDLHFSGRYVTGRRFAVSG